MVTGSFILVGKEYYEPGALDSSYGTVVDPAVEGPESTCTATAYSKAIEPHPDGILFVAR